MHILYHITPSENLKSILEKGIIPNAKKGLTSYSNDKRVWLTDNPSYILEQQAGSEWVKKYKPHILTVNIEPYRDILKAYITWAYSIPKVCSHEFYIESSIKPLDIVEIKHYES